MAKKKTDADIEQLSIVAPPPATETADNAKYDNQILDEVKAFVKLNSLGELI